MSYHYRLNCGQYVLHDEDRPIGKVLDQVALAFDRETGSLHKHGDPERVSAWLAEAQKKYREAGFDEMANQIVMISGRLPVEEVNRCISNSGYAGRFYQKLLAGDVQEEAWPGMEDSSTTPSSRKLFK